MIDETLFEAEEKMEKAVSVTKDDLASVRSLCRLIRDERRPWCPVNGLLVLVPWSATEVEETSRNGAGVLAGELAGVREEFRQRYPTFAMVTDLEAAWRDYNQMNSVQTVLEFDDMAKVLGRRIPESELIAFNRAWLARGRGLRR